MNNNTNYNSNNMNCHKLMPISLEEARDWYRNSNNDILKTLAIRAFSEEELNPSFRDIKSFKDACKALNLNYNDMSHMTDNIFILSGKANAAMFKLNIVRKALNLGQDLNLTRDPKGSLIYYPCNPFVTEGLSDYKSWISSKTEVIGKIKNEGKEYCVLGGSALFGCIHNGLGDFDPNSGIGMAGFELASLGCASREIAEHFGRYFGILITEAKYGDLPNFRIITSKYFI